MANISLQIKIDQTQTEFAARFGFDIDKAKIIASRDLKSTWGYSLTDRRKSHSAREDDSF